jgi:subtilisin family serine protease
VIHALLLAATLLPARCEMSADEQLSRFAWAAHAGRCESAGAGGEGSVIYVVDTGVLATHDELMTAAGTRVVAGLDVINSGAMPLDDICASPNRATQPCWEAYAASEINIGHGTGVASIAAGNRIGVAPRATIVAVRGVSTGGLKTTQSIADSLDAIVRHAWSVGAPPFRTAIVNMSFPLDPDDGLEAILRRMKTMIAGVDAHGDPDPVHGRKFLFVVAAGNAGNCGLAPAAWGPSTAGIITVGGLGANGEAWAGGCSEFVEVLAPAENIVAATATGHDHYRALRSGRSGTSWSAAMISGLAARILAEEPSLTPEQLEAKVKRAVR